MTEYSPSANVGAMLLLALLAACSKPGPTVTFRASSCVREPLEETRTRRINTTCALRGGSMNPHNPSKPCLMWNKKTIHERLFALSCSRNEWNRDIE